MDTSLLIQPYDDELMIYDHKTHRYVLTRNAIDLIGFGESVYRNAKQEERALFKTSEIVYDYIYSESNSKNRDYITFVLACYSPYREIFKEVLLAQLEADMESGLNSISDISPIDPQRNSVMNQRYITKSIVSPRVKLKLDSLTNPKIIYAGNLGFSKQVLDKIKPILKW